MLDETTNEAEKLTQTSERTRRTEYPSDPEMIEVILNSNYYPYRFRLTQDC